MKMKKTVPMKQAIPRSEEAPPDASVEIPVDMSVSTDEVSEYAESIINTVREPLIVLDQELRVVTASRSFYEVFKVNPEETVGQLIYDLGNKQWDIPKLRELLETILPEKATFDNYEVEHDFTDIGRRIMLLNARQIERASGKERIILLAIEDITERKRAEEAVLEESEESYRNLFENAGEAIFVAQDGKLVFFNPTATRIIGYPAEELLSMPFTGFIHPDDRDMFIDRHYRRVKEEASPSIYPFRIIHRDGSVRWVELNTVLINWQGKPATLNFLNDITERKLAEEQLRESLEQLRRAVETTIQVLVMAVEMKDPYTASHQRRMTDLARTMATEMGLSPEKIEGLRLAGVIHDIGKIILPTEILSKPTKLSDIEFSMIKEHVRLGYDILKDVESPWPLAEIVLQHHERMDGSGYPRGLKGEEILIEARILAVADVVEAMASHRPYRPALGIDAALEEIEKNRGLLYDSHAVDTCLRVFREKGYQIEGT
jgi:PAS domain S-box-containing protein